MINVMTIGGYETVINYDPDMKMFRVEFPGLNGGADFYARDVDGQSLNQWAVETLRSAAHT